MKDQRKDLRDQLLSTDAVTALVGDGADGTGGVWPNLAPLGVRRANKPYVTYSLSALERPRTHNQSRANGQTQADRLEFVLELHGEDIDVLDTLFEAIDVSLEGFVGAASSCLFLLDDATDFAEYKDDKSGDLVFTIAMNYIVFRRGLRAA